MRRGARGNIVTLGQLKPCWGNRSDRLSI